MSQSASHPGSHHRLSPSYPNHGDWCRRGAAECAYYGGASKVYDASKATSTPAKTTASAACHPTYTDYTSNVGAPPQVVRVTVMQGVVRTCTSFFTWNVYELPHAFTLWRDRIS